MKRIHSLVLAVLMIAGCLPLTLLEKMIKEPLGYMNPLEYRKSKGLIVS